MGKVTVCRCPKCGSLDAYWDEPRSYLEFTWMQCNGCGNGGLCDSWERDFDWYVEIEHAEDAPLPTHVEPVKPGHMWHDALPPDARAAAPVAPAPAAPAPAAPAPAAPAAPPAPVAAPRTPSTAPLGCAFCTGASDTAAAWDGINMNRGPSLVEESHYSVRMTTCSCGTVFAIVFLERVDFRNGEDDQTWLALPLTPADAVALTVALPETLDHVLETIGEGRRFLVRHFPSGGPLSAWWRDRGFSIGPHD